MIYINYLSTVSVDNYIPSCISDDDIISYMNSNHDVYSGYEDCVDMSQDVHITIDSYSFNKEDIFVATLYNSNEYESRVVHLFDYINWCRDKKIESLL